MLEAKNVFQIFFVRFYLQKSVSISEICITCLCKLNCFKFQNSYRLSSVTTLTLNEMTFVTVLIS